MNKSMLVISATLLAASMGSQATEYSRTFNIEDMTNDGEKYSVAFTPAFDIAASVIVLDVNVEGNATLSSRQESVCTLWEEDICVGPIKQLWHREFSHEFKYTVSCDDKVILNKFADQLEFTNEKLTSTKSKVHIQDAFINLNELTCETVSFAIETLQGKDIEQIVGSIKLSDSTSK